MERRWAYLVGVEWLCLHLPERALTQAQRSVTENSLERPLSSEHIHQLRSVIYIPLPTYSICSFINDNIQIMYLNQRVQLIYLMK